MDSGGPTSTLSSIARYLLELLYQSINDTLFQRLLYLGKRLKGLN